MSLEDLDPTTTPNLGQPLVNKLFTSVVKRFFKHVQRRRLKGSLEGTRHVREQHIPEKQTEYCG